MKRIYDTLSVIIPAYNKDTEVFKTVSGYVQQLKLLPFDWEIIVVDDASHDKTLREAVRSKKFNGNSNRIKIYSYNLNQGKGFALHYGFKKSTGNLVAFADADIDLPATNIAKLLSVYQVNSSDVIIGSKRHPCSVVNYPMLRRILSKTYQMLIQLMFNLNITDTQVGIKLFKRQTLEECFPRIVVKQFAFDLELLVVAKQLGYEKIAEAPINLNYNFTSTIKINSVLKILQDTLAIFYRKYIMNFYAQPQYYLEQNEAVLSTTESYI